MATPSNRLDVGAGRQLAEDLLDVDLDRVGHKAIIAEHDPQRLASGQAP